jgi:hypothetical protein
LKRNGQALLCAIKGCPRKAPGVVMIVGVRGQKKPATRNVCGKCIKVIRKKYGVM